MSRLALELTYADALDNERFGRVARAALEALILSNCYYLESFPETPALYRSGVFYYAEPSEGLVFIDIPGLIERGYGLCTQLSAWRIAELRMSGESKAAVHFEWLNARQWHCMVRRGDGSLEDPSARLGMKGWQL